MTINNNHFFDGINVFCDKTERQAIDSILHRYLQEQNFSRYYFLAYYLDPRFREDKRIEENEELTAQVYDALFCYATALGFVTDAEEDREKLVDSLDQFRNGDKLYGSQLLKCPKSPGKFWKHLLRFPSSSPLASCALRLLSISTRSMFLAAPPDDPCTNSLYQKILNYPDGGEFDSAAAVEKILPIKSYLLSRYQKLPVVAAEDDEKNGENGRNGDHHHGDSGSSVSSGSTGDCNISNLICNVITSLDQYSRMIAQPFSPSHLSSLIQPSQPSK